MSANKADWEYVNKLESENRRLREALDRIASGRPPDADEYFDKARLFAAIEIAKSALGVK